MNERINECWLHRRVRELHFVDIVDVEQLLEALGQDVAPVADRLQRLLLPSFFPGIYVCEECAVFFMLFVYLAIDVMLVWTRPQVSSTTAVHWP